MEELLKQLEEELRGLCQEISEVRVNVDKHFNEVDADFARSMNVLLDSSHVLRQSSEIMAKTRSSLTGYKNNLNALKVNMMRPMSKLLLCHCNDKLPTRKGCYQHEAPTGRRNN